MYKKMEINDVTIVLAGSFLHIGMCRCDGFS